MKIKELAENVGLNVEEFREILEIYIETTKSHLEELQAALQESDTQKAHERAHSIKGASGNLGLHELYDLAREIDDSICENSIDGLEDRVQVLCEKYDTLVEEFEEIG